MLITENINKKRSIRTGTGNSNSTPPFQVDFLIFSEIYFMLRLANKFHAFKSLTFNKTVVKNLPIVSQRYASDGFPIEVHWKLPDGTTKAVWATPGENLLDIAIDNQIDEETQGQFGMCGGACCCSTCHVILDEQVYANMNEATEDEDDILDYDKIFKFY